MIDKIVEILDKIRTPLALSGLVVVVLYGIYIKILEMDIFSSVSTDQTFQIINQIIGYLFWLALVAIILGVFGYLVNRKRNSD